MCWPATSPPSCGSYAGGRIRAVALRPWLAGGRVEPRRVVPVDSILHLVSRYGYLIVLFGVMAESTGVPLPGETILLAAGVLVQRGHLDLGDAIAFGILGAVL